MKKGHQNSASIQAQSKAQCTWRQTSLRRKLFRNVRTGCYLVFNSTPPGPLHSQQLAHPSS
jgi:hypothetical protein